MLLYQKLRYDLHCILGLAALLAVVVALGDQTWLHCLRVILGLPFILFFPGYCLIAALFPKQGDLGGIERLALGFGLSIAVVPLIGLGLNYTSWGIRLVPVLVSLIAFIATMSGVAWYRRRKLPEAERYLPVLSLSLPDWGELSALDRLLMAVLALAVIFAVGSIFYVINMPKVGERFTEFYILGPNGKAEGYPSVLIAGQPAQVIAGVVNHEDAAVSYTIKVQMGNYTVSTIGPIALDDGQKWEQPVEFKASQPHQNLEVQFLLFRAGDTTPYRSLRLFVSVNAPAAQGVPVPAVPSNYAPPSGKRTIPLFYRAPGERKPAGR